MCTAYIDVYRTLLLHDGAEADLFLVEPCEWWLSLRGTSHSISEYYKRNYIDVVFLQ